MRSSIVRGLSSFRESRFGRFNRSICLTSGPFAPYESALAHLSCHWLQNAPAATGCTPHRRGRRAVARGQGRVPRCGAARRRLLSSRRFLRRACACVGSRHSHRAAWCGDPFRGSCDHQSSRGAGRSCADADAPRNPCCDSPCRRPAYWAGFACGVAGPARPWRLRSRCPQPQ